MAPTETLELAGGGLSKDRLQEIVTRLKEVRRRCADEADEEQGMSQAERNLEALLSNLYQCLKPGAETIAIDDLGLRLAVIEELFENAGSFGLARVITNIGASLSDPTEDPGPDEEPPPPRRFEPPPTSAVRRRRPRPASHDQGSADPTVNGGGRFRWLLPMILIGVVVTAASALYLWYVERNLGMPAPSDRQLGEEPDTMPAAAAPTRVPGSFDDDDEFESHEEDMAEFTLEIHLAESTLQEGDLKASLRHFAAAAAIDRHHSRVIDMGKTLIAALLQEADIAYDSGDWDLAGTRVQNARNIARGLRLDDSTIDSTASKHEVMTRFEDVTPDDDQALLRAIGHPVRLTLKTRDVIFGHLRDIEDDILLVDVYSGVRGGGVEFSTSILASTIREVRVYDARDPSEIVTAD